MAKYLYKALDANGAVKTGTLDAPNLEAAQSKLEGRGWTVTKLSCIGGREEPSPSKPKITPVVDTPPKKSAGGGGFAKVAVGLILVIALGGGGYFAAKYFSRNKREDKTPVPHPTVTSTRPAPTRTVAVTPSPTATPKPTPKSHPTPTPKPTVKVTPKPTPRVTPKVTPKVTPTPAPTPTVKPVPKEVARKAQLALAKAYRERDLAYRRANFKGLLPYVTDDFVYINKDGTKLDKAKYEELLDDRQQEASDKAVTRLGCRTQFKGFSMPDEEHVSLLVVEDQTWLVGHDKVGQFHLKTENSWQKIGPDWKLKQIKVIEEQRQYFERPKEEEPSKRYPGGGIPTTVP